MSDKTPRRIGSTGGGVINELTLRIRLILRLMADRRIHPLTKLIPIGSLAYLLVPDVLPGPVDDALVITMATTIFFELCPDEIVQEHWDALTAVIEGEWREVPKEEIEEINLDE